MKHIFALVLCALLALVPSESKAAGYPVLVAYPPDSESYDFGNGEVWYFFSMPPPATLGRFDFQESRDAGVSWFTLDQINFTDPNHLPLVSVWVNPAILAPYVWYRYQPSVPLFRARSKPAVRSK